MTSPEMREIAIQIPAAVAQKMAETFEGTLEDATLAGLKLIHGMGIDHYYTLQELAKRLNTTVPKALRIAIDELQTQSTKAAPAPAPLGRPKINTERDTAIYLRVTEGATHAEVAHAFGISVVRVGQILAHQRAMRGLTGRMKLAKSPTSDRPSAQPDFRDRTDRGRMLFEMDEGMPASEAAEKYELTIEAVNAGYAAYRAELPAGASKSAKTVAAYAGIHAIDTFGKPEVLSLEVPVAQPRYVMPSLEALKAQQAEPEDTRSFKERDVVDPEFGF